MKRISIAAILASCALALALVGCSGGQSSVDEESLKGFWQIDQSSQLGFDAVLNLEDENLAELLVADGYFSGTWSVEGNEAKIVFEDMFTDSKDSDAANDEASRTAKLSMSDGKLVLGSPDGSKLVFVKGDMDAYYADEEASAASSASGSAASADAEADEDGEVIDLEDGDILSDLGEEVEEVEPVIEDMKAVTIVDDDTATVQITGKGTDNYGYVCYRLSVKNKSKSTLELMPVEGSFKVGGKSAEPFIDMEDGIAPDETVTTYLSFEDEVASVDDLKNVTGEIGVYKTEGSTHSVSID